MRTQDRWYEYTVSVTIKRNFGTFGIKYERQGGFRFCAQSDHDARAIAGHYVKGSVSTVDTTRMVEIVSAVPVERDRSNECLYGDHDFCNFAWCMCPHHSTVQFKLEHPQIPLHQPFVVERDEQEVA